MIVVLYRKVLKKSYYAMQGLFQQLSIYGNQTNSDTLVLLSESVSV